MDQARFLPYVLAVVAVLLVYRRLRRSFGRQPLSRVRMGVRIGILSLLACMLLPPALASGQFLLADLTGLAAGIALGLWGARRTRYQEESGRLYYVPHTYSGIAVSLLFIGRLVYRLVALYATGGAGTAGGSMQVAGQSAMFTSPFTVGLLFVVIGYYVCYYGMVSYKSGHISPEDLEVISTPIVGSPAEYDGKASG